MSDDAITHVASTAGGGGLVASILAWLQGRESRRQGERIAVLEHTVEALASRLDKLERPTAPKKTRRRA